MVTLDYYNTQGQAFVSRTIDRDVSENRNRFLKYLPETARILDAGCGSGRDTQAFLTAGYDAEAFDGSEEMVKAASKFTQKQVHLVRFQELDFAKEFDAIWANASIIHVPYEELPDVLSRLHKALKSEGILYASFKKGDSHRLIGERHFYDQDEITIKAYVEGNFTLLACWTTEDTGRAANHTKQWLNVILKKKSTGS